MAISEGCPAFDTGCPFVGINTKVLTEVLATLPKDITEKCPAFTEGCPFKADDSVETLYNHMSDMPATHRPAKEDGSTLAANAVERTLHLVHEKSKSLKGNFDAPCPVFATSCPFKTMTSAGQPMVEEMDDIVARWGLAETETELMAAEMAAAAKTEADIAAEPLSKSLKAGTKTVHRAAENVRFVRDFLKGAVPKESYIELLTALYHVYSTLEWAIDMLPKELHHVDFEVLRRTKTLEADLRMFIGTPEGEPMKLSKPSFAAEQYIKHIENLAATSPLLILAHAYTRYLGDLSGGQILAKSASKTYGLAVGEGTSFYTFELIGASQAEVKAFKKAYRSSLDALQLSAKDADAMVSEANSAFLMNILIFEERDVASGHLKRIRTLEEVSELVKSNTSALKFQNAYGVQKTDPNRCPFLPPPEERGAAATALAGSALNCMWPFIWLHQPSAALVLHPRKNVVGGLGLLVVIAGLMRARLRRNVDL